MDPLQVAMTGVRMGERYVQVFCSDATLTRGLATKTGLSGTAALAAPDETQAGRARAAASKAGVLVDVQVTPPATLPWDAGAFDMVVVDDTGGSFSALTAVERRGALQAALRLLRAGGRTEIIERIGGRMRSRSAGAAGEAAGNSTESAMREAGFNPVRTLAEKDGFRFVEGLKG